MKQKPAAGKPHGATGNQGSLLSFFKKPNGEPASVNPPQIKPKSCTIIDTNVPLDLEEFFLSAPTTRANSNLQAPKPVRIAV